MVETPAWVPLEYVSIPPNAPHHIHIFAGQVRFGTDAQGTFPHPSTQSTFPPFSFYFYVPADE